ncbi:MAG: radical SAM family heme chaperone HemW [Phycisphaerae bacterium]|nr:radical SAM family heme chaperone HemW [Phycisphaerae bacterium]
MESLGLYLHIPFCRSKCGYCDFYSVAVLNRPILPLIRALARELENRLAERPGPISTIFVGGGTPTVLPRPELDELMSCLKQVVDHDHPIEFTVEANPGTVEEAKLDLLTRAGVDRISMGAQSFHLPELQMLERLHTPDEIPRSVKSCRSVGIRRINLDLMFGIPGQTLAGWRESLHHAVDLGVEHIACYGLTYEPGTALTARRDRREIVPCDEELEAEMYLAAIDDLESAGYHQYEISNFAKPGERCLHNLVYWRNEPCIGVGPSAAGYLQGVRYKNVSNIEEYICKVEQGGQAVVESEKLTGQDLAGETVMLQLRLNCGIVFDEFLLRTGVEARLTYARSIAKYVQNGFLKVTDSGVALTRAGRLMADTVIADFIDEPRSAPRCRAGSTRRSKWKMENGKWKMRTCRR